MFNAPAARTSGRRAPLLLALLLLAVCALLVLAPPAKAGPRWGFADNWTGRQGEIGSSGLAGIGATTNRLDVQWAALQPTDGGPLNPGYLQQLKDTYNIMLYVGQVPIVSVGGAPEWARPTSSPCSYPGGAAGCSYAPDPNHPGIYDKWQSFLTQLLQQLPYPTVPPLALEIWNEPNYNRFWWPNPQPAVQAELLRRAVLARNAVYPGGAGTMPVVSGGLLPQDGDGAGPSIGPTAYVNGVYDAMSQGPRSYFDGIGVHPYPDSQGQNQSAQDLTNQMFSQIDEVRNPRNAHGDPGAPLWITEVGVTTSNRSANDQGLALVNMYRALSNEFKSFVIYSYFDGADPGAGGIYSQMGVRNKYSWCVLGRDLGINYCDIGHDPQPPGGGIQASTNIKCFQAKLNGWVNPHGNRTYAYFIYRNRNTGVDNQTATIDVGKAEGQVGVTRTPGGLARNTPYRIQLIAYSSAGQRQTDFDYFTTKNSGCANG